MKKRLQNWRHTMLPYLAAVIAAASLTACSEQKHEEITITQDESGTAGVISIDLEAQADGTAQEAAPAAVGTLIESQTFDVTLDGWGAVRFASYAPEEGMIRGDVSFFLMRDGQQRFHLTRRVSTSRTEPDSHRTGTCRRRSMRLPMIVLGRSWTM